MAGTLFIVMSVPEHSLSTSGFSGLVFGGDSWDIVRIVHLFSCFAPVRYRGCSAFSVLTWLS